MPRIDPIQLLRCLSVLLSPNGGIKSNDEVHRLASLMTKFSKKLVSKCIYIQILKCTETELLGLFMGSGGWRLAHMWLTESIVAKNWPLVRELLELLLLCPVDIDRLKTNNCPKLVKELSKDGSQAAIRALAAKLVEQWLKSLRGETVVPISESDIPQIISDAKNISNTECSLPDLIPGPSNIEDNEESVIDSHNEPKTNELTESDGAVESSEKEGMLAVLKETTPNEEALKEVEALPILKISLKDGKQVVSKLQEDDIKKNKQDASEKYKEDHKSSKGKSKSSDSRSSSSKSSSKHSHSSRSHSSKSSSDKHRSSSKSSSASSSSKDKSRDRSKESSRHSTSDNKHRDKKHSDKSHSSSSRKASVEKSKTEKSNKSDKSKDENVPKSSKEHAKSSEKEGSVKNKDGLEKPPSIHKMMKIPKLSDAHKREIPSISIESRKPNDPNRPKTVKTFNSKFRSHGLEEEAKPPPPRGAVLIKKPPPAIPPTVAISKRQSPSHNMDAPPEKKTKTIESTEKPGSIKLIPAKPKPVLLLESDMFMDALNASATNKKEPKKRKRRTSGSKDGNQPTSDGSPPNTPTASGTSPNQETKPTPFRFYKDTLETDEDKEKEKPLEKDKEVKSEKASPGQDPSDKEDKTVEDEPHVRTAVNGLRGVLCYHKKKGPKKSIRWRPDTELEQIQYFELDETERVNVSKTFTDMKHLERVHEREAFQKARNLINDDVMEARTTWRPLIPVDTGGATVVDYGKNSKEKEIQATRQKSVLQSLYLKSMIPDFPSEPDIETHPHTEPTVIPLDDITGNTDTISDFRNTPWPEPKGSMSTPNIVPSSINMPQMFPPMPQFPGPFPNAQFSMPGFQNSGPSMVPPGGEWQNNMPPMGPGGMPPGPMVPGPGPMPPVLMNPANMPPGLMMPPDNSMMGPDMFGGPGPMFPPTMPPEGFNMMDNMNGPPNMFPPGFPVNMPGGPPGHDNGGFPFGNRGGMRGRGSSNQWRGNWDGPRGRGNHMQGGWKKAKCIHFMKKGTCRSGDSCPYLHPGVNCPY